MWGENQFGQLGIGAADIVTKPSCVKTIKALGERVRNVAFGEAFAVILTGICPHAILLAGRLRVLQPASCVCCVISNYPPDSVAQNAQYCVGRKQYKKKPRALADMQQQNKVRIHYLCRAALPLTCFGCQAGGPPGAIRCQ